MTVHTGKRRAVLGASALCAALFMSLPAEAVWPFDSGAPVQQPIAAVSEDTVAQIQKAFDDQRYLDAERMLGLSLTAGSDDQRLVYLAGELSMARGRYDQALASFKAIDSKPEIRARALEGEGVALAQLGRSDEAVTALEAAVKENDSIWRAWNALGTEYDRRHEWGKADNAYAHAMTGSNGAAIVLNNRGFSRLSQGKLDDAAADFVAALQKKPDFTPARNNLRLTIAMKGDYDRAITGAAQADKAAALNNAGYAAMLRGDYAQAKDLFDRAMKAKGEYYAVAAANLQTALGLEADHAGAAEGTHDAAP
jgi:Flp pilus assembly protein TadD